MRPFKYLRFTRPFPTDCHEVCRYALSPARGRRIASSAPGLPAPEGSAALRPSGASGDGTQASPSGAPKKRRYKSSPSAVSRSFGNRESHHSGGRASSPARVAGRFSPIQLKTCCESERSRSPRPPEAVSSGGVSPGSVSAGGVSAGGVSPGRASLPASSAKEALFVPSAGAASMVSSVPAAMSEA